MDSWFDRSVVPPTRYELHYGGSRMVRCFADRPKSVHEMLSNAVARRPQGVALICGEDAVTYSELDGLVGKVAGGLKALGVGKGDRVAMVIGNSIEFVVVMFAIARLGAVSVPLNIRHKLAENRHIIEDCEAKVVVHEHDLADTIPAPGALPEPEARNRAPPRRRRASARRSSASIAGDRGRRRSRRKTPLRSSTLQARPAARRARC